MGVHEKGFIDLPTVLIVLAMAVFVLPFTVPVPPLENTVPAELLADPDSKFENVDGLAVHCKIEGKDGPALVLLHGFGSNLFTWEKVMKPLSRYGVVVAFDRVGFGLTQRPMAGEWQGENPYSEMYQADLTVGLMDKLGIKKAILIGNSEGGTVAMLTAIKYPDRVISVIFVDALIYGEGAPGWIGCLFSLPQMKRIGSIFMRSIFENGEDLLKYAWNDSSKIKEEDLEGYRKVMKVYNWDLGLVEFTLANSEKNYDLPSKLDRLNLPTLVITGDNDKIVPKEDSLKLSEALPDSKLVIVKGCGHLPQEECPDEFVREISRFIVVDLDLY